MSTQREIFSRNLRLLVDKSHLNQTQLADICEVSTSTFSDWLYKRSYPRPEKLAILAKALGVTEYDLISEQKESEERQYLPKHVVDITNQLLNNPSALSLYTDILKLSEEDKETVRRLVSSLVKEK